MSPTIFISVGDNSEEFAALGKEVHAISCASKPLLSWTARDAVQECRECCGGHGYFAGTSIKCLQLSQVLPAMYASALF